MNPFREYVDELMKLSNQLELTANDCKIIKSRVRTLKQVYEISKEENNSEDIITSQSLLEKGEKNLKDQKNVFLELKKEITDSILFHFKNISNGTLGFSKKELNEHPDIVKARDTYIDLMTDIYNLINDLDYDTSNIEKFHENLQTAHQKVFLHIVRIMMPLNVKELRSKSA